MGALSEGNGTHLAAIGVADRLGNTLTYTLDAMGSRVGEAVRDPGG